MFCEYCHPEKCKEICNCYILTNSDCLSCTQCGRVQKDFYNISASKIVLSNTPKYDEKQSFFFEISQKLNMPDYIAQNAYIKFKKYKEIILKSTKHNNILIAYCFKLVCDEASMYLSIKRIFGLLNLQTSNFVKTQKYLIKKSVPLNLSLDQEQQQEKNCDNIFFLLDVFCPKLRKKLIKEALKILKITDFKKSTVCCAVFLCLKIFHLGTEKTNFFLKICETKIGVKKNSIKKILNRYYKIKM